eukprot:2165696-Prymnesium_polylepis.1
MYRFELMYRFERADVTYRNAHIRARAAGVLTWRTWRPVDSRGGEGLGGWVASTRNKTKSVAY